MPRRTIQPVPSTGKAPEEVRTVRMMTDRVLVKPPEEEGERRTKGGLLIPPTASTVSKKGMWAEVVAVGPNVRHVEEGDRVLLLPDAGIEVEMRGEEYVLIREREIHAVATDRADPDTGLYL
jgi:chaperonin GroES